MRIAIISNIHGNSVALESVLNDLNTEHIDHLVCLGDIASGAPQPSEVIAVAKGKMDTWCLNPHPGIWKE